MMITMRRGATDQEVVYVVERITECGFQAHVNYDADSTIVAVLGGDRKRLSELESLGTARGVKEVGSIKEPFTLGSVQVKQRRTIVDVEGVRIGTNDLVVIAGPCSVESREQLFATAWAVKAAGATMLRGGAFKPRTSPYEFQGLGVEGLRLLKEAHEETGLPVVTEVLSPQQVELVADHAEMLQIGTRNMQNYELLREVAKSPRPVLLKRGLSATIKEWLLAAEYILMGGNPNVVLCERGIRTFESGLRNTLDLAGVALIRELSHLPVIVDPSHATGKRSLVPAASRAAVAVGADGLLIEVHPNPEQALCDGLESLDLDGFADLMQSLHEPARNSLKQFASPGSF